MCGFMVHELMIHYSTSITQNCYTQKLVPKSWCNLRYWTSGPFVTCKEQWWVWGIMASSQRWEHYIQCSFQWTTKTKNHQGPLNFSKNIVSLVHHGAYCALIVHIAPSWCTSTPYTVVVVYNVPWVNPDRQTDRQTNLWSHTHRHFCLRFSL